MPGLALLGLFIDLFYTEFRLFDLRQKNFEKYSFEDVLLAWSPF